MKTYSPTQSTLTSSPIPGTSGPSRLANLGRLLLAAMCVSLVSFAAAPRASAAAPNGTYEFTSASGNVKFAGETIDLPTSVVKRLAKVTKGEITIRNKTLKLNKNATGRIVANLADELDIDVEASVSGPNSLTLSKVGTKYKGRTTDPIVTSFEGSFNGSDFSGELETVVKATVRGKTLRIVIIFSGEALGEDFSGRVVIVAKR